MKLYAPAYYKEFTCLADRCRHSCCIGWEIDIDPRTVQKYRHLPQGYGERIRESLSLEEEPHFCMEKDGRCPHLAVSGLCNIITELGEDMLCDICREHPRFYLSANGRCEVGLGMACEEACRLILSSDAYALSEEIGRYEGEEASDFDTLSLREELYAVLSDTALPYSQKLQLLYGKADISPACLSDAEAKDLLASLEYLEEEHRVLFSSAFSADMATPPSLEKPLSRALAYFIYRHCTEAEDEADFRASLGFCFFLERLLASLAKQEEENLAELARTLSEEIEYSEENTETLIFEMSLH